MKAYTDTLQTKTEALASMKKHREADKLVKGKYWESGKGCAVGCQYHAFKNDNDTSYHSPSERVHGIPRALAYLEDRIFEGLPNAQAQKWPERFLKAIPVGADLSNVINELMYWLMTDKDGIQKHARPDRLKAIKQVAGLYKKRLAGKEPSVKEWEKARQDAADAAYAAYAAYAAADADAAAYAADAAYAAAYAAYAADAADAAYAAAYAADARSGYYKRIADKLIEILKLAPTNGSNSL